MVDILNLSSFQSLLKSGASTVQVWIKPRALFSVMTRVALHLTICSNELLQITEIPECIKKIIPISLRSCKNHFRGCTQGICQHTRLKPLLLKLSIHSQPVQRTRGWRTNWGMNGSYPQNLDYNFPLNTFQFINSQCLVFAGSGNADP